MPSPRSSPAMRPSSPLSPAYKNAAHFDNSMRMGPPSPRGMTGRPGASRRAPSSTLQLPPLPRFHPANFQSAHSSMQSTPDGVSSPQPPLSPRGFGQRNDLKKQMYLSQRELMSAAMRVQSPTTIGKPVSPRLLPMGSPGPVTPLELEANDSYLVAGIRHRTQDAVSAEALVDTLVDRELEQQHLRSPGHGDSTSL